MHIYPFFHIPYKRNRLPTWVFHKEGQIFTPRGKRNAYKRGLKLRFWGIKSKPLKLASEVSIVYH